MTNILNKTIHWFSTITDLPDYPNPVIQLPSDNPHINMLNNPHTD